MKKFYVVAGILSLVGCASPGLPNSYTVQIDSSFSYKEIAIIEAGMSSWTVLSSDAPTFDFQVTPAFSEYHEDQVPWSTIVIQKTTLASLRSVPANGNDILADTATVSNLAAIETGQKNLIPRNIGPTILLPGLDDIPNTTELFITVAHETGHACGLHHTGKNTIMAPEVNDAAPSPTCADLAQYCSLRPGLKCECVE